jgi:hypothetical protein
MIGQAAPPDIQYVGTAGVSAHCLNAIRRLIQFGDLIPSALLLTCENRHAFLLTQASEGLIAVRSGFASGYSGEGPRSLSEAISLLQQYGTEIEERNVRSAVIDRLDSARLTLRDIEGVQSSAPVAHVRLYDYVLAEHVEVNRSGHGWHGMPITMPYAIIDARLADLARDFLVRPDECLMAGYRRLEDVVRTRTGLNDSSTALFSKAFVVDKAVLGWDIDNESERKGRGQLFVNVFMAYRNPRGHRELVHPPSDTLCEFLLLNHLFGLERCAVAIRERVADSSSNRGVGDSG